METFEPKIIGEGYKVSVETTLDENIIVKRYTSDIVFRLARKQIEIQERIQEFSFLLDEYENVKIPKLLDVTESEEEIVLTMERIHNYYDGKELMTHVHIEELEHREKRKHVAGRGFSYNLEEFEEELGVELIHTMIRELAEILAILNFVCELRLSDIELILGKKDGRPILYIVDFDRASKYDLQECLAFRLTNKAYLDMSFDLLRVSEYINLDKAKQEYSILFIQSYQSKAAEYDIPERFIDAILNKLK